MGPTTGRLQTSPLWSQSRTLVAQRTRRRSDRLPCKVLAAVKGSQGFKELEDACRLYKSAPPSEVRTTFAAAHAHAKPSSPRPVCQARNKASSPCHVITSSECKPVRQGTKRSSVERQVKCLVQQ